MYCLALKSALNLRTSMAYSACCHTNSFIRKYDEQRQRWCYLKSDGSCVWGGENDQCPGWVFSEEDRRWYNLKGDGTREWAK